MGGILSYVSVLPYLMVKHYCFNSELNFKVFVMTRQFQTGIFFSLKQYYYGEKTGTLYSVLVRVKKRVRATIQLIRIRISQQRLISRFTIIAELYWSINTLSN